MLKLASEWFSFLFGTVPVGGTLSISFMSSGFSNSNLAFTALSFVIEELIL